MRIPTALLLTATLGACAAPVPSPSAAPIVAERVELTVAATTDVHGRLRGWDYYAGSAEANRGLARAATIVDSLRAAAPGRVILLDAGDLLQGNPLTYVAARVSADTLSPVVAAMNALQYDAAAVGNHEFNYGLPYFQRVVAQARFPFLAANAFLPNGQRAFPAFRIVERAGIRVGIVGATTPGAMVWDREHLRGRLELREAVGSVRTAVGEARAAGADVVILTIHSGLSGAPSYDTLSTGVANENVTAQIAREVPGLDLIVFGHSHREVGDTTIGGALLMQPKNWATSVAVATLGVERRGGRWTVVERRARVIQSAGHLESPAVVAAVDGAHRETMAYAGTTIGRTAVVWRADSARVSDTPLVDLILEVQRRATGADLSSTAAFSLDATLDSGGITVAELARLYPYDNTLRAVRISGRQLREYLEFSSRYYRATSAGSDGPVVNEGVPGYNFDIVAGADYTMDISKPLGSRITRLAVKGRPVTDADSFTFALNNYRQTGGGGYVMLHGAPVVYDEQQEIRQLLIDEVRRRGSISPADYHTRNWTLEPAALAQRAFAEMQGPRIQLRGSLRGDGGVARPSAQTGRSGGRVLRIVSTNDFHGAFSPRADSAGVRRGGAAYLASAIQRASAECAPSCLTLLLDGGDIFQGTPASNMTFGRSVVELFGALGYGAAALGNHEFDWGQDTLRQRMAEAPFAILGANVRYSDGRDVEWIRDDTLLVRGDVRVGIIGISTVETPRVTRAANVIGLRFDDPAPIVDARARALRARGADLVVVVAHAGGFCGRREPACSGEIFSFAAKLTERIDAIVSGHSHSRVHTVVNGIPILQALSSGRAIAIVDIPLLRDATTPVPMPQVREVRSDSLPPSLAIDSLVRRSLAAVAARVDRPVGRFATALFRRGEQYPLGHLVADAQRWAAGTDVAVMNNGGIRADVPAGAATYGTLFEVQPFGNTLYRLSVTGTDLLEYFEKILTRNQPRFHFSGVTIAFDTLQPPGQRVVSVTMANGRPLRREATYTLSLNDFMVTGGDGAEMTRQGMRSVPLNIEDLDALVRYVESRPQPVVVPRETRLRVVRK